MRKKKDKSWLYVVVFMVFVVVALTLKAFNTIQVCKTQDVFWVSGTQYTCEWFK